MAPYRNSPETRAAIKRERAKRKRKKLIGSVVRRTTKESRSRALKPLRAAIRDEN